MSSVALLESAVDRGGRGEAVGDDLREPGHDRGTREVAGRVAAHPVGHREDG